MFQKSEGEMESLTEQETSHPKFSEIPCGLEDSISYLGPVIEAKSQFPEPKIGTDAVIYYTARSKIQAIYPRYQK